MEKFAKIVYAAGIALAITLTFSCSDDSSHGGGGGTFSPSSSSNAWVDPCSLELPPVAFPCNDAEVAVGGQIWSKCNLNVAPGTGSHACYCNKPENCEKYGRLYDWATAMALDSSCNSASCDSQINHPHQGICPPGWYIPSDDDWERMVDYASKEKGHLNLLAYLVGDHFKATSGWNISDDGYGNGTDIFGFSALPGGYYGYYFQGGYYFNHAGNRAYWWSATEGKGDIYGIGGYKEANKLNAYATVLSHSYNLASVRSYEFYDKGSHKMSVRCLKDHYRYCIDANNTCLEGPFTVSTCNGQPSNICPCSSSPSGLYSCGGSKGSDIANYRTVQIGNQVWMAENLDHNVSGAKCYNDSEANCNIYGMLYDWATAMALPSKCNSTFSADDAKNCKIDTPHKGICPAGWHIPSDAEWTTLTDFAGGDSIAGTKLKSASGWLTNTNHIAGTDNYGFKALPGGYYDNSNDWFNHLGHNGLWWSATETGGADSAYIRYNAYIRNMYDGGESVNRLIFLKNLRFSSVRCIKD